MRRAAHWRSLTGQCRAAASWWAAGASFAGPAARSASRAACQPCLSTPARHPSSASPPERALLILPPGHPLPLPAPGACSNFQGFGKELFTDAGKYVVHFGSSPTEAAEQVATAVQVRGQERFGRCLCGSTNTPAFALAVASPGARCSTTQEQHPFPSLPPQAAHPDKPPPPVTALARARTDVSVIPTSTGEGVRLGWLADA